MQQVNGVIVNKLTLAQYRELKANNELQTNECYIITDIDENLLIYKESLDVDNPIILRNLETGIYKIYGYFRYNANQSGISGADPFAYAIIEKATSLSYVTLISSNSATRYKITDSDYENLDDTGWIELNDYISYRKIGEVVYLHGSATTSNELGTIPQGFRPLNNHVFLIAGSGTYYAKARVTNNGAISILGGTGTTTAIYEIETSYPVN